MLNKKKVFPDFFVLGAAKCGTTSIHSWLDQHSEICMSLPKEPRFFEAEFEKGMDFYWEKYFNRWKGEKLVGDARPRNLHLPYVPERIKSVAPDAKFIVTLRNPVERTLSFYWDQYTSGNVVRCFEDAIKRDHELTMSGVDGSTPENLAKYFGKRWKDYKAFLDIGQYAEQIERYLKLFPRDRLKIVFFEDLSADPKGSVIEICKFLGLDTDECENFDYHHKKLASLLEWKYVPRRLIRELTSGDAPFMETVRNIRKRPVIRPVFRKWLVDHFRPYNKRLEEITGRNLDHWV